MREIIFRGKRIDNGEWVYGSLFVGFKKCYICPEAIAMYNFDGALCLGGFIEVDPSTVGQYIGQEDTNGEMIFDGDVCRFREWSNGEMCWVGKVHWEHQQFMISGGPNKECETMFELCMSRFIPENIEVIGNIHDNPELIKEAQP